MKSVDKLWKRSVLKSLIISFIAILLPIYILSIIIYNWGIKTLRREISNSMIDQVSNYLSDLENEIERIQILQQECLIDENLNRLAAIPEYLDDIAKMQSILRLQQRLSAIKNSSGYISDVFVFIPAINKKISADTYYGLDLEEHNKLKPTSLNSQTKVNEVEGRMILSVVYPFWSVNGEKRPIFTLVIELSKARIEAALNSMVNNKDEEIILINLANKTSISTQRDLKLDNKIQSYMDEYKITTTKSAETLKINGRRYLAVYAISNYLGNALCKYTPEDSVFKALRKYQAWFILLTVVALAVIITYSMYMYKFIHKPLGRLAKAFKQVETGDLNVPIEHEHDDEFRYIYRRFNAMAEKLKALIEQVYKQKILAQKAELKQLQSQINPHFLYNSFFILNTMSRVGDYETMERFTEQLGEYFQFITRSAADEITLSKEVNHARVYTEIQAMRFSNRVSVEFDDLPEGVSRLIVPRLIIQPIIENAFEYGLEKKASKGLLRVNFEKIENRFCILIEDNGEGLTDEELEKLQKELSLEENNNEITGILNISQRIRLKFGDESGLSVARGEMGGLKVTITIKLREGECDVPVVNS